MIAPDRVAAVLLAAGRSERFGDADKLLVELDGKPLARHAADMLATIEFGRLIVVTSQALTGLFSGFETVVNREPGKGQSRSIRLGVQAAESAGCDAVLIALADMPFVSGEHCRALLAAHERLTASTCGGPPLPPALFDRLFFQGLKAMSGDRGARSLLAGATLVEAPPHELRDIDTPADLSPPRARSS